MWKIFFAIFILITNTCGNMVYANATPQSQQIEQPQEKSALPILTTPKNEDAQIGIINITKKHLDAPPIISKEKFLEWLEYKHNKGEYLDITEEMINFLTDEEFNRLLMTEFVTQEVMPTTNENAKNFVKALEKDLENEKYYEEASKFEPTEITSYDDLYQLPEDKEKSLTESIKQYTEEKKEAVALIVLGGAGGLLLLKKGKKLLAIETAEEKEARKKRLNDIRATYQFSENDFWEDYKKWESPYLSLEENLKNITEEALNPGITQKQMKILVQEQNKSCDIMTELMDIEYRTFDKEMADYPNIKDLPKEEKQKIMFGETSVSETLKDGFGAYKLKGAPTTKERVNKFARTAEEIEELYNQRQR